MNLKIKALKALKLMTALGVGASMIGATAFAASPITFGQVVAEGNDMSAALGITKTLSGVSVAGENLAYEDIPLHTMLNATTAWPSGITHDQLSGLFKGDMRFSIGNVEDEISTEEKVVFLGNSLETGLSMIGVDPGTPNQNYLDKPFMHLKSGSIKYQLLFNELLPTNAWISNFTKDEPLTLTVLGHKLRIEGTGDSTTKLVVVSGEYCDLLVGESCTAYGKKIDFIAGSNNGAKFKIDGVESEWIKDEDSYKFKDSGLDIHLEKIHDIGQSKDDFNAEFWVSDAKARKIYDDGDGFIGEDEKNPDWKWELDHLKTNNPSINVSWSQNWDNYDEVVYIGESFGLPGGRATIKLDKLVKPKYRDYTIDTVSGVDLYSTTSDTSATLSSADVLRIRSEGGTNDGLKVGGKDTDEVYFYASPAVGNLSASFYYYDTSAKKRVYGANMTSNYTNNQITLEFEDTSLPIEILAGFGTDATIASQYFNISLYENASTGYTSSDNRQLNLHVKTSAANAITYLGLSAGDTTTTKEWSYGALLLRSGADGVNAWDISEWKENVMTDAGIILVDPDASQASDKYTIKIPQDISDFDVRVKVFGPGISVAQGIVTLKSDSAADVIVTPKEADTKQPVILVGGPCANKLTADALGLTFQACGEASGLKEGEAVLKLVENAFGDQAALLVYGWSAEDTARAAGKIGEFTGADMSV